MAVYQDGFRISGVDRLGNCIPTKVNDSGNLADMGDPVLNFKENLTVGCSVKYDLASFEKNCVQGAALLSGFQLFQNLEDFTYFGEFGNADLYRAKVSLTIWF